MIWAMMSIGCLSLRARMVSPFIVGVGSSSIGSIFAERPLKLVQGIVETAPGFVHRLHLLSELDALVHLDVVFFLAFLDLILEPGNLTIVVRNQQIVIDYLLVKIGDTRCAPIRFKFGKLRITIIPSLILQQSSPCA